MPFKISRALLIAVLSAFPFAEAEAISYDVANFSFESVDNPGGLFGQQATATAWGGSSGNANKVGLGNANFTIGSIPDGDQLVSIREGGHLRQDMDGSEGSGFTRSNLPLAAYDVGDQVTLTVSYALRNNVAINWAEESYIALYDSSAFEFDVLDPLNPTGILAMSPFVPAPATRDVWADFSLSHTMQASDIASGGFLGILLVGYDQDNAGANWQVFYDNVRLEGPELVFQAGDVNLDGVVDEIDFGFVRDNFLRTNVTRSQGDLNSDNIVDFRDFQLVVNDFQGSGTLQLFAGNTSVPEPSSILLIGVAIATGAALCRRRSDLNR